MLERTMVNDQTVLRIHLSKTVRYFKYSGLTIMNVILEILTAVTEKYNVLLDVKHCSLVEMCRFWGGKNPASIVGAN
jgi:hypothetical protein